MSLEEESYKEFNIQDYDDITPMAIESNLGNDELCKILYTDEYKQLMGLAKSMLSNNELSARAFRLTSQLINLVPAFYTIWNYRFNILSHLINHKQIVDSSSDFFIMKELDWLDQVTLNNPKNYQIWSYRQSILTKLIKGQPSLKHELPIIEMMLNDDTKNYHVWSYRKWVVKFIGDYTNELSFANNMIDRDVYNNSAWNHRMFYLKQICPDPLFLSQELDYVKTKISLAPQNVSSWNYLRGLLNFLPSNQLNDTNNNSNDNIETFISQFLSNLPLDSNVRDISSLPDIQSSYALEFLADIYASKGERQMSELCYKYLSIKYDPIRKNYWNHKIKLLSA